MDLLERELCYRVQGCIYEVYRRLGHGFLEKVYERALEQELRLSGFAVRTQVPFHIDYKGVRVGEYVSDLVIENRLIIELKAQEGFNKAWEAQLLNYLNVSGCRIGLLVNFTYPKAVVKRFVK